jgi:hypothetical protein
LGEVAHREAACRETGPHGALSIATMIVSSHPAGVLRHLIIPEPQHAKPLMFEPTGAQAVSLIVGMLAAIHFDNEMFLEADKNRRCIF